jgi:hypothetical protein
VKADPATLNSDNLIITDNTVGGRLPGTFSISSDLTVLTFLPNATLPAGHNFTAQFFTYQDLTGNPGSGGSTNFTTSSATDNTPPSVVTTNPLTGLTNVPTNAVLHILFNKPVQPTSLRQVQVLESGSPMVITTALTNGNQTLTLMPNALFTPNAAHSMTITGVKDMSGNVIVGTVTINFTTGGGIILNPSIPAPAFSPTNNSTGQSVNVQPTVTYSVPIDPVVAFTGSVRMRTTTTLVLVPTTFSISADSKTLTIIPSAPLANATQYTIFSNFGSTVVDQAGNSVTSGQSIFTTQ